MKLKLELFNHYERVICIVVFTLCITFLSGCRHCNKVSADEQQLLDSLHFHFPDSVISINKEFADAKAQKIEEMLKLLTAEPITPWMADTLKSAARAAFTLADGSKPTYIEPQVSVSDLLTYIKYFHGDRANWGIRIYPGFDSKTNRLIMILAISNEKDKATEVGYYLLDQIDYRTTSHLDTGKALSKADVLSFVQNYAKYVKIYTNDQSKVNENHKFSRFYSWEAIELFLSANKYYKLTPVQQKDYFLIFGHGYSTVLTSKQLYTWYEKDVADSETELIGYSVTLDINDYTGSLTRYFIGTIPRNERGVLEIGKPCPPRCEGSGIGLDDIFP